MDGKPTSGSGTVTLASAAYGLCVIGSGLWRYLGSEGGSTGLIFGFVMGAIALLASIAFFSARNVFGHILAWSSVIVVCGWFIYEAMIKKGFSEAEPRQLIVIGISCIFVGILIRAGIGRAMPA
ncbi:MAG: hypothetical protein AAF456_07410 [Planctomycetota bacterium]